MPTRPPPPAYDRWHDADGNPIPEQCRVEQVAENTEGTVLPSRLHEQGQVLGRDLDSLYVCFPDNQVISLRPHLVRVLDTAPSGC